MKGRVVKEEYEGRRFTEETLPFYGNFWGEVSLGLHRGELSSVVRLDQHRHWFVGGFGHGGQDIHMISWRQEVFLVGRVEQGFGQCLHSSAKVNRTSEQTKGYHQTQVFKIMYLFLFCYKILLFIDQFKMRMCSIKRNY